MTLSTEHREWGGFKQVNCFDLIKRSFLSLSIGSGQLILNVNTIVLPDCR